MVNNTARVLMVHNYLSCASITEILLKSISVTKEIDSLYLAQSRQMDSSVFMDFVKYAYLKRVDLAMQIIGIYFLYLMNLNIQILWEKSKLKT